MKKSVLVASLALAAVIILICSTAWTAPIKMSNGFYYPTERAWTGNSGGAVGDPKQPWNDGSPGGRIYGFMDPDGPRYLGKNHVGIDVRASYNSPVYAVTSGSIYRYINSGDSRYWCVIVRHQLANGTTFYGVYGHCRLKSGYSTGRTLSAGENFAYINESGNQHIHFGIKLNSDFSTGWGHLSTSINANSIGWRGPRTFMMNNTPPGGTPTDPTTDPPTEPDPSNDTTAPSISLTEPASTQSGWVQKLGWNVTDSGSGVASVTLQWNSGTATAVSASGTVTIPEGDNTATIKATDKAGNVATKTAGPYSVRGLVVTTASGLFSDGFYVQNRECDDGFRIDCGSSAPDLVEGDTVLVSSGQFTTVGGEQYLSSASVVKAGRTTPPAPVKQTVSQIRGEAVDAGVLISLTGTVTWVSDTGEAFYVDDGSNLSDGYHTGMRIVCDGFADGSMIPTPDLGAEVTVTGIGSRASVEGKIVPAIRLRSSEDIIVTSGGDDPPVDDDPPTDPPTDPDPDPDPITTTITTTAQANYRCLDGISYSTQSNLVSVIIESTLPPTDPPTEPDPSNDTTAPTITLTGPSSSADPGWAQTIQWNVTDSGSGVASVTLQWNSGAATAVSASGTVTIPEGDNTATIKATDKAGNVATKTAGPYSVRGLVVTTASGLFSDGFYVQNRECDDGFRIDCGSSAPDLVEGDTVLVSSGQFTTVGGEQYLSSASVVKAGRTTPPAPVKQTVSQIRGETVDVGVLISVTGTVSWVKSTGEAFYVDDGSNLSDGYHTGMRIVCDGFADGSMIPTPELGAKITVTGISSRANVLGKIVPAIRLRNSDDMVFN